MGDAKRGHVLAENGLLECHAIDKGAPRSRNGDAPTFESIANTRGMTPMALRVAFGRRTRKCPIWSLRTRRSTMSSPTWRP
jgi:hypothetical protein